MYTSPVDAKRHDGDRSQGNRGVKRYFDVIQSDHIAEESWSSIADDLLKFVCALFFPYSPKYRVCLPFNFNLNAFFMGLTDLAIATVYQLIETTSSQDDFQSATTSI
jgi:hypothetical protein